MQSAAKRTVLVTGASSGIGEAFAEVFASRGFNLVLTARREDRLRAIADRLEGQYSVGAEVVPADLSRPEAPGELCAALAEGGIAVDALVNNAGYGMPGAYTASPWERHAAFLQVMVVAVAELTHRLLPPMIERGYGRIVNVASLAGLVPSPAGHTLYGASKAFMIRFSEALARETRPLGVHVTAVCPGFTYTEFHDVNGMRSEVSRLPRFMWMDARTVAEQGFDAVMGGAPICVNGRLNSTIATAARLLPYRLLAAIARRTARTYRRA